MNRIERTMIYPILILLATVNVVFLLSNSGRSALAEASAWLSELGPAEALKLTDGDKEMTVRNKKGRIAWGDGDFKQTYSVAFIDISKVLNPLMEGDAMKEDRERLGKELEQQDKDYQGRLDAFREELKNVDRTSPEGQAKLEEAQKLFKEYTEWREKAIAQRNELDVQHLEKSYKELSSAVDVVAEKLGIDIVLRFIPTEKEFKSKDAEQALTEIRLRTAVKYPGSLDITTEVMEELSIQATE